MDKLDNVGKSKVLEKWLNQLKIFSEKCYEEFMNINQVKKMYLILKEKNKINDNEDIFLKYHKYYAYDEIFGIDARGNILEEGDDKELRFTFMDSLKLLLLKKKYNRCKNRIRRKRGFFHFFGGIKKFFRNVLVFLHIIYKDFL